MGNFQACMASPPEVIRPDPPTAPFDARRSSDDSMRDSSFSRAVVEASINSLAGVGGAPLIRMVHRTGATCDVYLLGATITSYRLPSGLEVIFLPPSFRQTFDGKNPIEGGIPVVFPQFGRGGTSGLGGGGGGGGGGGSVLDSSDEAALPRHGFARGMVWEVDERQSAVQPDGSVHLVLVLRDTPDTRALDAFPHAFELEYAVKLTGRSLQTSLTVTNPRLVEWAQGFQAALLTHLALDAPPGWYQQPRLAPHVLSSLENLEGPGKEEGEGGDKASEASVVAAAGTTTTPSSSGGSSSGGMLGVSVHGLHGASFLDRLKGGAQCLAQGAEGAVAGGESKRDPDSGDFARGPIGGLRFTSQEDSPSSPSTVTVDRVYLSGTGNLRTVAGAEIHFDGAALAAVAEAAAAATSGGAEPPSSSSKKVATLADACAGVVVGLDGVDGLSALPPLPAEDMGGTGTGTAPSSDRSSSSPHSSTSSVCPEAAAAVAAVTATTTQPSSFCGPSLMRGVAVVEATCSRAANSTWSDNSPSPDLVISCPSPFAPSSSTSSSSSSSSSYSSSPPSSKDASLPSSSSSQCRALCVAPGLISSPIKSLIDGRMTLTQTISFIED